MGIHLLTTTISLYFIRPPLVVLLYQMSYLITEHLHLPIFLFLIAGKLIKSGWRFILKLQEDWAYKEEYNEAERRLEGLAWFT